MNFLINLVFGLFVLSTICYWISLTIRINENITRWITTGITIIANILLFIFLAFRWITAGYFPLSNLYESLLFLTWCLTSVQLISEIKTSSKIIGSIISPLNLLLIGFSTSVLPVEMQKAAPLVPALQSNWLMLHVSMMMVSYATLILGSLLSILFLILNFGSSSSTKNYIRSALLSLLGAYAFISFCNSSICSFINSIFSSAFFNLITNILCSSFSFS